MIPVPIRSTCVEFAQWDMWESFLPGTPKHGWFLTSFEISVTYVQDTRLSSSLASSAIITLDGPSLHGIVPVPGFENCDHWPSNASFRSMTLFHVFFDRNYVKAHVASVSMMFKLLNTPSSWGTPCTVGFHGHERFEEWAQRAL